MRVEPPTLRHVHGHLEGARRPTARTSMRSDYPTPLDKLRAMHVTPPGGGELELADGASGLDAAAAIGPRLARAAVAVGVNGEVRDLRLPLSDGEQVRILTDRDAEALAVLRHSTAHVMAEAVLHLW